MLQEIGVFDEGLEAFLESRPDQESDGQECDDGDSEKERFLEWASENLVDSRAILDFAEERGARVEVVNSAAKVTGHNNVMIPRIQCFHKQAWNPKGGDWKTFMSRLWEMGLRRDLETSAGPEYCKWCKAFKNPQEIADCASTQFTCRRLEGKTWKLKL